MEPPSIYRQPDITLRWSISPYLARTWTEGVVHRKIRSESKGRRKAAEIYLRRVRGEGDVSENGLSLVCKSSLSWVSLAMMNTMIKGRKEFIKITLLCQSIMKEPRVRTWSRS